MSFACVGSVRIRATQVISVGTKIAVNQYSAFASYSALETLELISTACDIDTYSYQLKTLVVDSCVRVVQICYNEK